MANTQETVKKIPRPDHTGAHERLYRKNRATLIKTGEVCQICGGLIDKSLKFPHPLSASVDHIVPVAKGGHPSSMDNLQLAHLICNQVKGTKETIEANKGLNDAQKTISNRVLPLSIDWLSYKG